LPDCAGSSSSDSTVGRAPPHRERAAHAQLALSRSGWSYSVSLSALAAMRGPSRPASFGARRGRLPAALAARRASRRAGQTAPPIPAVLALRPSASFWPLRAPSVTGRAAGRGRCSAAFRPPAPLDGRVQPLVNRVDLGIVGNAFERDVRHGLVDEAARSPRAGSAARSSQSWRSSALLGQVMATREVSQVIQRRPHFSAT
jgi:hypothetical protein